MTAPGQIRSPRITPQLGPLSWASRNRLHLAGLKVIELGTLIAGPFAARICAEFGAEVIKVESPDGGDPLRKWRKVYEGTSLWWFVQARNKQSITLNLKSEDGIRIL